MARENRVNVILDIIKTKGIDRISQSELVKMVEDLTTKEANELFKKSIKVFGIPNRIDELKDVILFCIHENINSIQNEEYYQKFLDSLNNNTYIEYIKTLSTIELNKIKIVVISTYPDEIGEKLVYYLKKEIYNKEQNKNLTFL